MKAKQQHKVANANGMLFSPLVEFAKSQRNSWLGPSQWLLHGLVATSLLGHVFTGLCKGMSKFVRHIWNLWLINISLTKIQEAKVGYANWKNGCRHNLQDWLQISQYIHSGCPKIKQVVPDQTGCPKIWQTVTCSVLSCISGSIVVCEDCYTSTDAPIYTG